MCTYDMEPSLGHIGLLGDPCDQCTTAFDEASAGHIAPRLGLVQRTKSCGLEPPSGLGDRVKRRRRCVKKAKKRLEPGRVGHSDVAQSAKLSSMMEHATRKWFGAATPW